MAWLKCRTAALTGRLEQKTFNVGNKTWTFKCQPKIIKKIAKISICNAEAHQNSPHHSGSYTVAITTKTKLFYMKLWRPILPVIKEDQSSATNWLWTWTLCEEFCCNWFNSLYIYIYINPHVHRLWLLLLLLLLIVFLPGNYYFIEANAIGYNCAKAAFKDHLII